MTDQVRWHVALCLPGTEDAALVRLGRIKLTALWLRSTEVRVARGLSVETHRSIAPGCLFIKFDGASPVGWHDARDAVGLGFRRFIGGEWPDPVSDKDMEPVLARLISPDGILAALPAPALSLNYAPGDQVRLTAESGPFASLIGAVSWVDDRGLRLALRGAFTSLYLPMADAAVMLEKIERADASSAPFYGRHQGRRNDRRQKGVYR